MIAMFRLYHKESCGVSDIANHLGFSDAAASQMIERLVQRGFMERKEDPVDRRVKKLTLTEEGKAMVQKAMSSKAQWAENITRELSPDQLKTIGEALEIMIQAAHRMQDKNDTAQAEEKPPCA